VHSRKNALAVRKALASIEPHIPSHEYEPSLGGGRIIEAETKKRLKLIMRKFLIVNV
jgi:hypothetical protein